MARNSVFSCTRLTALEDEHRKANSTIASKKSTIKQRKPATLLHVVTRKTPSRPQLIQDPKRAAAKAASASCRTRPYSTLSLTMQDMRDPWCWCNKHAPTMRQHQEYNPDLCPQHTRMGRATSLWPQDKPPNCTQGLAGRATRCLSWFLHTAPSARHLQTSVSKQAAPHFTTHT